MIRSDEDFGPHYKRFPGERGEILGSFSSYDLALSGAYGADISGNLSAGIGLKFIRSNLADQGAGIERGKGLGQFAGKAWRVGLMGESSKPEYVLALLSALDDILPRQGYEIPRGAGVGAASMVLAGA